MSRFARYMATVFAAQGLVYTNLLTDGACEVQGGWNGSYNCTLAIDSNNEYEGENCIKVTLGATNTIFEVSRTGLWGIINASKYYLVSAYLKNSNLSSGLQIRTFITGNASKSSGLNAATDYVRHGILLQPSDISGGSDFTVRVAGTGNATGQYGYYDAWMINEITADDYAAGVAACLEKYPYKAP